MSARPWVADQSSGDRSTESKRRRGRRRSGTSTNSDGAGPDLHLVERSTSGRPGTNGDGLLSAPASAAAPSSTPTKPDDRDAASAALPATRLCVTCRQEKPTSEYPSRTARRCGSCTEAALAAGEGTRRCTRCNHRYALDEFDGIGRHCTACRAEIARETARRSCMTCKQMRPVDAFARSNSRRCKRCAGLRNGVDGSMKMKRRCKRCGRVRAITMFAPTGQPGGRRQLCVDCVPIADAEAEARRRNGEARKATWKEGGRWVRRCCDCRKIKSLRHDFYPAVAKRSAPLPRRMAYICKSCSTLRSNEMARQQRQDPVFGPLIRKQQAEYRRRWRRQNPGREGINHRAYLARVRADPERYRVMLENQRIAYRMREERKGRTVGTARRWVGDAEPKRLVPSWPLAAAIEALATAWSSYDDSGLEQSGTTLLCELLEISPRTLMSWRIGQRPFASEDLADRILQRLDLPWWEVWNEETTRRYVFEAVTYFIRHKEGKNGKPRRNRERLRSTRYVEITGPEGVDEDGLAMVQRCFGE
jgi:hypothetical protein